MVTVLARMGSSVLSHPTSLAQAEKPPSLHLSATLPSVGVLIHLQSKLMQRLTILTK